MIDTQVRVVNEFGDDVANNGLEQGEVIVKGLGVMNDNIDNNKRINADGWLHTGDRGTIDVNGHIKIIKPHKDLIINSGENASSIEIENVFYKHPAVQEVVIIATPHNDKGETLHGFVVLNNGYQVTEQELIIFSKKYLGQSGCPNKITFMDELPKTTSGKILKVQLGESFH